MTKRPELMWPTYQSSVLPAISYCSSIWSPVFKCDDIALEQVQCRFIKATRGFNKLEYSDRLNNLIDSFTLQQRRMYSDMVIVFMSLHGLINCSASDLGISLIYSRSHGGGIRT